MLTKQMTPFEEFRAKRGNVSALARKLGISPSAVQQWGEVPIARARKVSEITGIALSDLRPDLWPRRRTG